MSAVFSKPIIGQHVTVQNFGAINNKIALVGQITNYKVTSVSENGRKAELEEVSEGVYNGSKREIVFREGDWRAVGGNGKTAWYPADIRFL